MACRHAGGNNQCRPAGFPEGVRSGQRGVRVAGRPWWSVVHFWQILLQKSQNAERLIVRERTKQAAITDRCSLKRAAEVACEFVAGCSSPPHQYSIAAPTARKTFDRWDKKTFATLSRGSPDIARTWRGPMPEQGGLGPVFARHHVRQSSLEYVRLRGEGSNPVPLPPPAYLRP
jgi:hypothetical protein